MADSEWEKLYSLDTSSLKSIQPIFDRLKTVLGLKPDESEFLELAASYLTGVKTKFTERVDEQIYEQKRLKLGYETADYLIEIIGTHLAFPLSFYTMESAGGLPAEDAQDEIAGIVYEEDRKAAIDIINNFFSKDVIEFRKTGLTDARENDDFIRSS